MPAVGRHGVAGLLYILFYTSEVFQCVDLTIPQNSKMPQCHMHGMHTCVVCHDSPFCLGLFGGLWKYATCCASGSKTALQLHRRLRHCRQMHQIRCGVKAGAPGQVQLVEFLPVTGRLPPRGLWLSSPEAFIFLGCWAQPVFYVLIIVVQ